MGIDKIGLNMPAKKRVGAEGVGDSATKKGGASRAIRADADAAKKKTPGPRGRVLDKPEGEETIVDKVLLGHFKGNMSLMARELTKLSNGDDYVSRATVNGWANRGQFPAAWVVPIHKLTGVPVEELLARKSR